jgi:hypothetical protein
MAKTETMAGTKAGKSMRSERKKRVAVDEQPMSQDIARI